MSRIDLVIMVIQILSDKDHLHTQINHLDSLLLDFDGTLVDYYKNEEAALGEVLSSHNIAPNRHHEIIQRYRVVNEELWKQYELKQLSMDEVKINRFETLIAEYTINAEPEEMNTHYIRNFGKHVKSYPGIVEKLQEFREDHPALKIIILTNGSDEIQRIRASKTGLDRITDGLISSDLVGKAKPSPVMFEYAQTKFDIDLNRTFMVGDSLSSDITGAKNLQIPNCLIDEAVGGSRTLDPVPDMISDSCISFLDYISEVKSTIS